MKIKTQKKIHEDTDSLVPFGHYIEYKGILLRCEEGNGKCNNCYFHNTQESECDLLFTKEDDYRCFNCANTDSSGKTIYRRFIYED